MKTPENTEKEHGDTEPANEISKWNTVLISCTAKGIRAVKLKVTCKKLGQSWY